MRDPVRVRVIQPVQHLASDAGGAVDRQAAFAVQRLAQRVARDIGHHEPEEVVGLPGVEQAREVGVVQLRDVTDLPQEAVGRDRDGELRVQDLDRDLLPALVVGAEDGGVPAPAHRRDDGVAVAQRLADPLDQVVGGHPRPRDGRPV